MCENKLKLTEEEISILDSMYEGDSSRDASSKVRGFIFQDLVTIDLLLNKNTKYVCSEFIEDIYVIYNDGTFKFIQVKYYPKTKPNMKEIMTDLYYQSLRLDLH